MEGTDGEMLTDGAAICINRFVTIEAQVPGSVVLNAGNHVRRTFTREGSHFYDGEPFVEGGLRVLSVDFGGTDTLIGLNITGGHASVRLVAL